MVRALARCCCMISRQLIPSRDTSYAEDAIGKRLTLDQR